MTTQFISSSKRISPLGSPSEGAGPGAYSIPGAIKVEPPNFVGFSTTASKCLLHYMLLNILLFTNIAQNEKRSMLKQIYQRPVHTISKRIYWFVPINLYYSIYSDQ